MERQFKRTKIVCTIGPATRTREAIRDLARAGADVFRINFSHSSASEALETLEMVKQVREELRLPLAVMGDIKGPAVRLYGYNEAVDIEAGDVVTIESWKGDDPESSAVEGPRHLWTNLPEIDTLVKPGQRVLLMDGYFLGEVVAIHVGAVDVKIGNAGRLRPKAHLTIPNVDYPIPFLSSKDVADLALAAENEVEYVALSFVRSGTDIEEARRLIQRSRTKAGGRPRTRIIAKIESAKGLANIEEIVEAADGVMVARGDMGVEMAIEAVPIAQKRIIRVCRDSGRPAITATQMLESMIESPIPTRAEASDVANACFDSTSAVMLSGETAIGKHPVRTVETMSAIIRTAEAEFDYETFHALIPTEVRSRDLPSIVTYSAVSMAYQCGAAAILVFTETGGAARGLSRLRPRQPIIAFATDELVRRQLALSWGVVPLSHSGAPELDQVVAEGLAAAKTSGYLKTGDRAVVVAGLPLTKQGSTNVIRVETVK